MCPHSPVTLLTSTFESKPSRRGAATQALVLGGFEVWEIEVADVVVHRSVLPVVSLDAWHIVSTPHVGLIHKNTPTLDLLRRLGVGDEILRSEEVSVGGTDTSVEGGGT